MDISVIIVSWNTKDLLKNCLDSLLEKPQGIDFEIIVIDNASNDRTAEFLNQITVINSKITVIKNFQNLGFAKACNQGIKQAKGKYFLFLNPDTQVGQGTLPGVVEFFEKNSDCGIVGGKILNGDGTVQPSVRRFPQLFDQLLILLKLHRLLPNFYLLRRYFCFDFDCNREQEVDQVMGAFMGARREVMEKLGGFDEKFFLWFEEVDLCKRAKQAGWKVCYTPSIQVKHQKAASFKQLYFLQRQIIWNNSLSYYFKKHHSFWQWLVLQIFCQSINWFLALIIWIFLKHKVN